jgi:ParB/RepB/Spo0J family partition protein
MKSADQQTPRSFPQTLLLTRVREKPNLGLRTHVGDISALVSSVRVHGIIEPMVVRPNGLPEHFDLVCGYRRYAAAMEAGLESVPVVVRTDIADDLDASAVAASENSTDARHALDPMDEARLYKRFLDGGRSKQDIADRCGCSYEKVRKALSLLGLPENIQQRVEKGGLKKMVGVALMELSPEVREEVIPMVDDGTTEAEVKRLANEIVRADDTGQVEALAKSKTVKGGHASRKEVAAWRGKRDVNKEMEVVAAKLVRAETEPSKSFWAGAFAAFSYMTCRLDDLAPGSAQLLALISEQAQKRAAAKKAGAKVKKARQAKGGSKKRSEGRKR